MGDDYRDLDKRDRLGDPDPPPPRCSFCRGFGYMRGKRCPECDGVGTLDGQTTHMAMLVACAAAEDAPRREQTFLTVEKIVETMGGTILELFRLPLGPGDVLVWHAPANLPPGMMGRHVRAMRDNLWKLLPPENRPSAFAVLPHGSHLDAFNVPGVSDAGIVTGLQELGDGLAEVRPAPLGGGLVVDRVRFWQENLKELLEKDRDATAQELRAMLDEHGFEFRRKPTFAEIMAERARGNTVLGRYDTPEDRQQLAEALEKECLKVIECDSQGVFSAISDALAAVQASLDGPSSELFTMIVMSKSAKDRLGKPHSIHGVMVSPTFYTLLPGHCVLVVAVKEGEPWEPGHVSVVRWTDTGDPLAGLGTVTGVVSLPTDEHTVIPPGVMEKAVGEYVEKCEKKAEGLACSCGHITKLVFAGILAVTCACGRSWYRDSTDDFWKPLKPMNLDCNCGIGYRVESVVFRCHECGSRWKRETVNDTTFWGEMLPETSAKYLSCFCGWLHKDVIGDAFRCSECNRSWEKVDGQWQRRRI